MAKTFYTERDIEDLHRRGVRVLDIDNDVVLTDLARERALSLGIRLARGGSSTSVASASVASASVGSASTSPQDGQAEVVAKVKAAVLARLGEGVDPTLLEAVITRVVAQIK